MYNVTFVYVDLLDLVYTVSFVNFYTTRPAHFNLCLCLPTRPVHFNLCLCLPTRLLDCNLCYVYLLHLYTVTFVYVYLLYTVTFVYVYLLDLVYTVTFVLSAYLTTFLDLDT